MKPVLRILHCAYHYGRMFCMKLWLQPSERIVTLAEIDPLNMGCGYFRQTSFSINSFKAAVGTWRYFDEALKF